jgi:hypothetical protein
MCGICVADQSVTSPSAPDLREHAARLDRVRDQRRLVVAPRHDDVGARRRTLRRRASRRSTFVPSSSWTSGAPSCERPSTRHRPVERLVVDVDELGRVRRGARRLGDHDRDAVALVARLVRRERVVRRLFMSSVTGQAHGIAAFQSPAGRRR